MRNLNHVFGIQGNIFDTKCAAIVNPVNCKGAMGKGLALQFKNRFPEMYQEYRRRCFSREVKIGSLDLHYLNDNQNLIINFPTKDDWRNPSKKEYLIQGLQAFIDCYQELGVTSFAFPMLGVGYGGLDFDYVLNLMLYAFSHCEGVRIEIWKL